MDFTIDALGLRKTYESGVEALKGIDLQVRKGELFGLIGPDGAGKTTLIRILTTLILPDEGQVTILGLDFEQDFRQLRKQIGYLPGKFSLYADLTVEENLTLFATIFGTTVEENYHLIRDIYQQIEPFKNRLAGNLSGGMKQKLALSCALIHAPELLVLDEPTTGVDAVSRREFWEVLQGLKAEGMTILVSTPYMDEASLCDRVALMQEGELMKVDTPSGIVADYARELFSVDGPSKFELMKAIREYPHTDSVFSFGNSLHYTESRQPALPEELEAWLQDRHLSAEIEPIKPNIEDCFMALMRQN